MNMPIGRRTEASMELRVGARCTSERAGERGQSLFEFALVLPIVMLVLLGMVVFGIAVNNYLELTNGTTAGAQAVSIIRGQNIDPCAAVTAPFYAAAYNLTQANVKFTITISSPPPGNAVLYHSCECPGEPHLRRRDSRSDTGRHHYSPSYLSVQSQLLRIPLWAAYLHVDGANCGEYPMKKNNASFAGPVRDGQRGQSLVMIAILLPVLLGMAALVIDLGYAYASYQELLSATQAAALAGGATIPNPSGPTASTVAQQYSAAKVGPTKELNWKANLQNVSTSINLACVSPALYPTLGLPQCNVYPSCPAGCNMIQVTTSAKVPTFFAKIFGVANIPITATATAAARGGGIPPYHVMLVLDTTASMGPPNLDTGCTQNGTSVTPEQCAQFGVQTLLDQLHPCPVGLASCQINPGQPGSYLNPVDQVGLMVFPGLCSSTGAGVTTGNCTVLPGPGGLTNTIVNTTYASAEYACPPTTIPQTSYNNNPEYLILGFQGNFRTSDTSPLNTNANLFKAIGAGTNNCGVSTPANFFTFYGGRNSGGARLPDAKQHGGRAERHHLPERWRCKFAGLEHGWSCAAGRRSEARVWFTQPRTSAKRQLMRQLSPRMPEP